MPKNNKTIFHSQTYGDQTLDGLLNCLFSYLVAEPEFKYRIIIGTDSQGHRGRGVDFVTAIIVHRVGAGGIYFWQKIVKDKSFALRERIFTEASIALSFAQKFLEALEERGELGYNLEIHVDVGTKGETREIISEVVGMIRGSGFEVKIKPEAFGAAKVADRHT